MKSTALLVTLSIFTSVATVYAQDTKDKDPCYYPRTDTWYEHGEIVGNLLCQDGSWKRI